MLYSYPGSGFSNYKIPIFIILCLLTLHLKNVPVISKTGNSSKKVHMMYLLSNILTVVEMFDCALKACSRRNYLSQGCNKEHLPTVLQALVLNKM